MTSSFRLTPLLAVAALALTGCGGDDNGGGNGGTPERSPQQVVAAGDVAAGEEVYGQNCAACHGADGGGGSGPELAGREEYTNADVVVEQIRDGGGAMPPFEDRLSDQELSDVSAFVTKELATK